MSSAFYPQGMNSWNNRLPQGGYKTWKGSGLFRNPVGITSGNIRPFTNKDYSNVYPTGFGLPRPIKHYRRGITTPVYTENMVKVPDRQVKSSVQDYMVAQMIDQPGRFIVKENGSNIIHTNNTDHLKLDECTNCQGVKIVSSWYPINNLTEKPQLNVTNPLLCCNQQRKAKQRVLGASTNVKKNYYQTNYMYLYNRCQTFQQREFNFISGDININVLKLLEKYPFINGKILEYTKPGSPLSLLNLYVAQCNPNESAPELAFISSVAKSMIDKGYISQLDYEALIQLNPVSVQEFIVSLQKTLSPEQYDLAIAYLYEIASNPYNGSFLSGPSNPKGCKQVYYKPNNPQFAKQGGVSSSTRILKLNVDTISSASAANWCQPSVNKLKIPPCQLSTYSGNPFFFQGQHQNKKICSKSAVSNTYVSINQHSAGNYIGSTLP
jgi:hypothetical protein